MPAPLRQAVISWRGPLTTPAAPVNPLVGLKDDVDRLRQPLVAMEAYFLVDEACEPLHAIEDGLNL